MKPHEFKNHRLQMGLTQSELAKALDLSPHTIIRFERGQTKIWRVIQLALLSLKAEILSGNTAAKGQSIAKYSRRKVNALRSSHHRTSHIHAKGRTAKRNAYMLWIGIALAASPRSAHHKEAA